MDRKKERKERRGISVGFSDEPEINELERVARGDESAQHPTGRNSLPPNYGLPFLEQNLGSLILIVKYLTWRGTEELDTKASAKEVQTGYFWA